MDVKSQMERIYGGMPLADIPWNNEQPPAVLVDVVDSGRVGPCEAVDLGCGAGNYATWLAERGFRVTGIDVSSEAIALARARARRRGVSCDFMVADLLAGLPVPDARFDFAFEWELLHHIVPADRFRYAGTISRLLRPGAVYLSVCFAEDDPGLPGDGKLRTTPLGTQLYLSSERELRELLEPLFDIEELATIEVPGSRGAHRAVRTVAIRRQP